MFNIKKSYFIFYLFLLFLLITLSILFIPSNLISYATETYLYKVNYDYTHIYSYNGVESTDSTGTDVSTSNTYIGKNTKGNLYFQLYGDSYTTEALLSNGGCINSSFVHIIVNSDYTGHSLTLKNSNGDTLLSGTTAISKSLSDGTYTIEYVGTGSGWLVSEREYAFYKIKASFSFTVDTKKPTITGATTSIYYTNQTTKVTPSDERSGVGNFYVKGPVADDFSICSYPYNLSNLNQNGLYTFYVKDKAGNSSDYHYIYLDTEKPEAYFSLNSSRVETYYIKDAPIIYTSDNDSISGVYIKENDGDEFLYNSSYVFPSSKKITMYAMDRAGNKSNSQSIFIDNTKPVGTIYKGDIVVNSGELVSNEGGIKYESLDTESKVKAMYYKKSSDPSYTLYSGEALLDSDTYSFYSIDNAGNTSDVVAVTLDNNKPTITLYLQEKPSTLTYTNYSYFKVNAYDENGLKELYYMKNGKKTSYTNLSRVKDDGDYSFYAVDKAGNISDERRVVIDRATPILTLIVDGNEVDSGSYNKDFYLQASDTLSGVEKMTYSQDGSTYNDYLGETITKEGNYYFYAYDKAGNRSCEKTVILDKTKPTIKLKKDGEEYLNKYVGQAVTCEAEDNFGVSSIMFKEKNDPSYSIYSSSIEMKDGEYYFYALDNAGNQSDIIQIIKDSVGPSLSIFAGDSEVLSNSITAKSIRVQASDENLDGCFVLMDGNDSFIPYNIGNILSFEGEYKFYAIDKAGNKTETKSITIDKSKPEIKVYKGETLIDKNIAVNESFKIEAKDTYSIPSIYIKTPGAVSYSLYDGSYLSLDGKYYFYAEDTVLNKTDEYYILIDYTSPNNKIYAQGEEIYSLYTNKDFIVFSAEDGECKVKNMYIKEEGDIREYFGEKVYLEGEYSFFAVDEAGNKSQDSRVIIDRQKPTGEIKYGTTFIKCNVPFYFVGYDDFEIDKAYIKSPVDEEYMEYNIQSYVVNLIDGTYSFYLEDKAGNRSIVYTVEVDLTKPNGNIYEDGVIVNKRYTNKNFYYKGEINSTSFIKTPLDQDYSLYNGDEIKSFSKEGEYFFYSIDEAGNKSDVISIVLDNIKPEGILYSGTKEVDSLSFVSSSISFKGISHISNIKSIFYTYKTYVYEYSGQVLEEDGEYQFYAIDEAENESDKYIITIDRVKPTCKLFENEKETNSLYTNKDRISLEAIDTNLDKIYVKIPNSKEYIEYSNNSMYSLEGEYLFYAIDKAGNRSSDYKITIDRQIKSVKILSIDDENVASSDVTISWEDKGLSKIYLVTVNDIEISNGTIIHILENGVYEVRVIDEAKNENRLTFTSNKTLYKKTGIYEYYEVKSSKEIFQFKKYSDALDKAKEIEWTEVIEKEWTDSSYLENIKIDEEDKKNVKNGTYYLYKSEKNENEKVAYFTDSRLDIVLNNYAKNKVTHYYYYEKEASLNKSELYQDKIILDELKIDKNFTYYIDGNLYEKETFSEDGTHSVKVLDNYNNELSFNLLIVKDKPSIFYSISENKEEIVSSEYYFKDEVKLSISSIDQDSNLIVKNESGEIIYRIKNGEEAKLDSGKYSVYAINHKGQTAATIIYVSLNPETVSFNEINNSYRMEIKINKSIDKYSKLQSISIYKNGEKIVKDDLGNSISISLNTYTFRTSGEYEVTLEDNFRKINDQMSYSYIFKKANPIITITNILNTYTNQNVDVSFVGEGYVELFKDGVKEDFIYGTIKKEGNYTLYFRDYDTFEEKYEFIIDKTNPKYLLSGVEIGKSTNQNVKIKLLEEDLKISVFKDGDLYEYQDGEEIVKDGEYSFEIADRANNKEAGTFSIDKEVEFSMNTLNGAISSSDVIINSLEELKVQVLLNDEQISYSFGESLVNEGEYHVIVEDKVGNLKEVEFLIQKSKLKSFSLETTKLSIVSIMKDSKVAAKTPLVFTEDGTYDITLTDGENVTSFQIIIDTEAPLVSFVGVLNGGTTTSEVKIDSVSEDSYYKAYLNGHLIENPEDGVFKDTGVYTIYFYDSVGNESQYTFEIKEDINKGLIFIIILVVVVIILIVVFVLIFKKKNKKIKELQLKKDPIEKEEEKHVVSPVQIIKEDTEEVKKELEEKNMVISRLHPRNRKEEEMLIKLNRMDAEMKKEVEKEKIKVEEIVKEESKEDVEEGELVEEEVEDTIVQFPFYPKIIKEMSKEDLYNLKQDSIIDDFDIQVRYNKFSRGPDKYD